MELAIYLGMMPVIILIAMVLHISGLVDMIEELGGEMFLFGSAIFLGAWPLFAAVFLVAGVVFVIMFLLYNLADVIVRMTKLNRFNKKDTHND